MLYRFGRAYPAGWDAQRRRRCIAWHSVEWLDADGSVLAQSDAQQRDAFLAHVGRAPRAAHRRALGLLMQPLVSRPLGASRARCAFARSSTTACR